MALADKIVIIDLSPVDALPEPQLQMADQLRLSALGHDRRRAEFIAGRALLQRHGLDVLRYDVEGKPWSVDGRPFSLSHSRGWLALALADDEAALGIDLEFPKPGRDLHALLERCLQVDDHAWQQATSAAREQLFYLAWVVREAAAKADGRGLVWSFSALRLRGGWSVAGQPWLVVQAPMALQLWAWQLASGHYLGGARLAAGSAPAPVLQLPAAQDARLLWHGSAGH